MTEQATTGVQELIDRLSQEGVVKGQQQADQIVSDAERRAGDILDGARQQANDILKQAREDADQFQAAGEEALGLASRDAVREFGARIHEGLRHRLQELVQHQITDPQLVKRMILEVTRQATEGLADERIEILLPSEIISEAAARQRIEAGDPDELTEFVQGLIGEDLREGFTVDLSNKGRSGITLRVIDQNVEIDLTDETISELFALHLLPRFRAIMRKA